MTQDIRGRVVRHLHPRRLYPSLGAIAGLAGTVSLLVGFLAQRAIGHGWHRMFMTLHLARPPLIVRIAPVVAAIAVGIATAAALLRFYNWTRDARPPAPESGVQVPAAGDPAIKQQSPLQSP